MDLNSVSGLSRLNGSEETFLLVTAALANLTFMSPLTSTAMKRVKTADSIVRVVKMSPFTSLFAKDQVYHLLICRKTLSYYFAKALSCNIFMVYLGF